MQNLRFYEARRQQIQRRVVDKQDQARRVKELQSTGI